MKCIQTLLVVLRLLVAGSLLVVTSALSVFFVKSVLSSMTVGGGAGIGPVLVDLETMVDGLQTKKLDPLLYSRGTCQF